MITGAAADLFETFTLNRTKTITVYKQPIKNISSANSSAFPGYGPASNNNNLTSYTVVSGVFPAVITYVAEQQSQDLYEIKKAVPKDAKVLVRVERNCSDYIENGKTEKIVVNGDNYNVIAEKEINSILGLNYYHYYLGKTT